MEHFIKQLLFSIGLGVGGRIVTGEDFSGNLNRFISGYHFKPCSEARGLYVFEGESRYGDKIWLRYTVADKTIVNLEVLERVP